MVHGKRRGILVFSCVGVLLSVTIVLLVTANQAFATTRYFNEGTRAFTYINYRSCVQEIKRLNEQYPDLVEIGNAQEKYGVRSPGDCGGEPCTQWFLRITNEATLRKTRPEVFFSGSLHGNEEIGPTTTIEFARLLLENYKFGKNPWLKRLVNTRSIYIMPSANAWGYFHETREERLDGKRMDPNRDFGYDRNSNCMETTAARAVNELWREHLFQLAITFHGGMRAISYEWGSIHRTGRSPDDVGFSTIAQGMGTYAGNDIGSSRQFYPVGTLTDKVYGVAGGMEDWAYAASWDMTYTKTCNARSSMPNGVYPTEKTKYTSDMLRVLNVLVETENPKKPAQSTLGKVSGIFQASAQVDGHIPRNIRLCLLMTDTVQPYIQWRKPLLQTGVYAKGDGNVEFAWDIGGAFHVDETALYALRIADIPTAPASTSDLCPSLSAVSESRVVSEGTKYPAATNKETFWASGAQSVHTTALGEGDTPYTDRFSFDLDPKSLSAGIYVIAAGATVDSAWKNRHSGSRPSGVQPQSHIVKARTIDGYNATNAGIEINGKTKWLSEFLCIEIDEKGGFVPKKTPNAEKSTESNSDGPSSTSNDGGDGVEDVFFWTIFVICALLLSSLSLACVCRWAYKRVYLGKYEKTEIVELTSMADDDDRIEKYKDDMHDPTVDGDDIEIAPDGRPVFRSIGVI